MSLDGTRTDNLGKTGSSVAKKYAMAKYLTKMNEIDKAANNKIVKNMEKKINFLKNPRFKINRPPITFQQVFLLNLHNHNQ